MTIKLSNRIGLCLLRSRFFSYTGRGPASFCHGLLSVVRLSVRAFTFSLNIFSSDTTNPILTKFHRNVLPSPSSEFLERIWFLQKLWLPWQSLNIFLSETIRLRATKFGPWLYLMGLYQVSSNYSPGVKTLEISLYLATRSGLTKFCM